MRPTVRVRRRQKRAPPLAFRPTAENRPTVTGEQIALDLLGPHHILIIEINPIRFGKVALGRTQTNQSIRAPADDADVTGSRYREECDVGEFFNGVTRGGRGS